MYSNTITLRLKAGNIFSSLCLHAYSDIKHPTGRCQLQRLPEAPAG